MSGEVSGDLVAADLRGNSHSKVLDTLKSRYSCIDEPLPAASTRRYLTSLWVFWSRGVDEPESPLPTSFYNLMVDQYIIDTQMMIREKITAALTVLSFREPRVLVQFWSPVAVGKRCLLMTLDQPFGIGVADEGLYSYRLESEQRMFVVGGDYEETELGPPGRVYQKKCPEWSLDIHDCYNIRGYIDLPVFEPSSGSCVGVLELVTSSNYVDYAFEVREVSRALKEENLKSPSVFEDPSFDVQDERRQHELDEIFGVLKMVCETSKLPLAQTWALSGYSSFVANSGNLEKICSSFNKSCIGKVCMSTAGLPFYVRNLSMWGFREACRERHLEKSNGVVGRSLSSRGLCFCGDVTKLGEDEYPLVAMARMKGITGCLAIYLESRQVYGGYVIELFFPPHTANKVGLQSLVETVKQLIKNTSGLQLGIMSSTQVIGGVPLNWNLESSPLTEKREMPPESENQRLMVEDEQNDVDVTFLKKQSKAAYVEHTEEDNVENEPPDSPAAGTSQSVVPYLEKEKDFDVNPGRMRSKYSDISDKTDKKRRADMSISLEEIRKRYGNTLEDAAVSLHGAPSWPYSKGPHETDYLLKSDQTNVLVQAPEGALIPVFEPSNEPSGTTNGAHDHAALTTEQGKQSSTSLPQQQEQTNLPDGQTTSRKKFMKNVAANTVGNVTIKATYGSHTVKFPFSLSEGLVKLEEQIATRFQLRPGSFSLKYTDEEGDEILVACDNDLTGLLGGSNTVIKLLVHLLGRQGPNA